MSSEDTIWHTRSRPGPVPVPVPVQHCQGPVAGCWLINTALAVVCWPAGMRAAVYSSPAATDSVPASCSVDVEAAGCHGDARI